MSHPLLTRFASPPPRPADTCPRPEPTPAQEFRVTWHRTHTRARQMNPTTLFPLVGELFDAQPSQECREVSRVSNRK